MTEPNSTPPAPRALWACVHCNRACLPSEEICPWCGKASGVLDSAPREPGVDHDAARKAAESIIDSGVTGMGIQTLARAYLALRVPAAPVHHAHCPLAGQPIRFESCCQPAAPVSGEPDENLVEAAMRDRIIERAGLDPNDCDTDSADPADHVVGGIDAMRRSLDASLGQAMDEAEQLRRAAAPSGGSEVSEAEAIVRAVKRATYSRCESPIDGGSHPMGMTEQLACGECEECLFAARLGDLVEKARLSVAALRAGGPTHG